MHDPLNMIAAPLTEWFKENRRDLPWRQDREPYHVWVSEIMLQQTRIEAVKRYYSRFMQALPDVRSLSQAEDEALLKLWEGLGYYSRARNLKKAAQIIMSRHGGVFPRRYDELIRLPGIGEYTAGAIASICFDEKAVAVDGNVLRVIARVTADSGNVLLPETKRRVAGRLCSVLPEQSGMFNEGLMELGELVCLPNGEPLCRSCPLNGFCLAYKQNLTTQLPVREKTIRRKSEDKSVFLLLAPNGRIAIEQRTAEGLLSGLYQLPNLEGFHSESELTAALEAWGLAPRELTFEKQAKHVFTHIDWNMRCYRVQAHNTPDRFLWVSREELEQAYPLPTAFKKLLSNR